MFLSSILTRVRVVMLLKLHELRCNLDSAKYYFTNRVVNLWNNLPENVVAATTVSIFKDRLAVVELI